MRVGAVESAHFVGVMSFRAGRAALYPETFGIGQCCTSLPGFFFFFFLAAYSGHRGQMHSANFVPMSCVICFMQVWQVVLFPIGH